MDKRFIIGVVLYALTLPAMAEGDAAAGEKKSHSCYACHGSDGVSINNAWPNLAGQKAGYLEKQITDFRDGRRNDPIMAPLVKGLSDQDIADIAAHFSAMSGEVKPIPKHL